MEKVVAKFNVMSFTKFGNGGGGVIKMAPVIGGSEENEEFWKYTPAGNIEMTLDNDEALKVFENLGEFYVTFKKA